MSFRPFYLDAAGEPLLALYHPPADAEQRDVAVVMCPPLGWDDIGSYRSRHDWAEQLAQAGYPTLRFDLPGTSDSGGSPEEPNRLQAWVAAATAASQWLRGETGRPRTAAIGIGAGGIVACLAAASGAPIDDLVLWGVPARGRTFVRELRAFARIEATSIVQLGGLPPPEGSPDVLAPGGFVVAPETAKALEAVDVASLDFPDAERRRVLLVGRDGIAADDDLRRAFADAGATVEVDGGTGYGAMMAEPHFAVTPQETIDRVLAWLAQPGGHGGATVTASAPQARDFADLDVDGARIRESPFFVDHRGRRLFGIVSEPVEAAPVDLCIVFVNAAAIRRVGPNRMWVDIARRWSARGVSAVRVDLGGIGDSDGTLYDGFDELYGPGFVEQVQAVLDALPARGLPDRFVMIGLCSGGYWAFQGALAEPRVAAAVMLNPRALIWDPGLEAARDLRRMRKKALSPLAWRRVLDDEIELTPGRVLTVARWVLRTAVAKLRRSDDAPVDDELDEAFDRLRDSGTNAVFVFCGDEPLADELEEAGRLDRADRWPNLSVERVAGRDHTLRPVWMQELAHAAVDRALEREVARAAGEVRIAAGVD